MKTKLIVMIVLLLALAGLAFLPVSGYAQDLSAACSLATQAGKMTFASDGLNEWTLIRFEHPYCIEPVVAVTAGEHASIAQVGHVTREGIWVLLGAESNEKAIVHWIAMPATQ